MLFLAAELAAQQSAAESLEWLINTFSLILKVLTGGAAVAFIIAYIVELRGGTPFISSQVALPVFLITFSFLLLFKLIMGSA